MRPLADASAVSLHAFVTDHVEPGARVITDGWQGYRGLEKLGYVHQRRSQRAARTRGDPGELLPAVHRVASLIKRWLLGTHQGSVDTAHLTSYLNEFVFRFNRRRSRSRGMVFYERRVVCRVLRATCRFAGLPRSDAMQRAHEVLYYVGLGEARYRNIETYSTGMKQRIKLAQALVHDPDLLFLDEPTNGMDPKGREEILELVTDLATRKGVNLILSSHLLPDVEATCDRVVVMHQGAIAIQGSIAELKEQRRQVFEVRIKGDVETFIRALEGEGAECHGTDEDVMRVFLTSDQGPRDLFGVAARHQIQVRHLRPSVPTLEDVFAEAMGEE